MLRSEPTLYAATSADAGRDPDRHGPASVRWQAGLVFMLCYGAMAFAVALVGYLMA